MADAGGPLRSRWAWLAPNALSLGTLGETTEHVAEALRGAPCLPPRWPGKPGLPHGVLCAGKGSQSTDQSTPWAEVRSPEGPQAEAGARAPWNLLGQVVSLREGWAQAVTHQACPVSPPARSGGNLLGLAGIHSWAGPGPGRWGHGLWLGPAGSQESRLTGIPG